MPVFNKCDMLSCHHVCLSGYLDWQPKTTFLNPYFLKVRVVIVCFLYLPYYNSCVSGIKGEATCSLAKINAGGADTNNPCAGNEG